MTVAPGSLVPMTYSASRTSTFVECNRIAAWKYIAGVEDVGDDATDTGKLVHAVLEQHKKHGYQLNLMNEIDSIAAEALPFVEDFRWDNGMEVEGARNAFEDHQPFFVQGRHLWTGFKDLRRPGHVTDYKTSGNFKWAKTPEALLVDPQAVLYAVDEFVRGDWHEDVVHLQWLYLSKRKPYKAKPVTVDVTRDYAFKAFEALERIADELEALAAAAPADPALRHKYVLDVVQPNYDRCSNHYGKPCPHQTRCGVSFFNSSPSDPTTKAKTMNLLEQLQSMDTAMAQQNGAVPGAATRVELPPMMAVPTPFVPPSAPAVPLAFAPGGAFHGIETAVPPTDAPSAPPTTERMIPAATSCTVADDGTLTDGVAQPGQINPPKRGRGRPPGSKNKDATPTEPAPAPTFAPPPALSPAPVPAPAPAPSSAHRIATLYVGCMPRGSVGAVDLDVLVAKAKIAIGPQAYYANFGYKTNGLMLQMLEQIVQHDRPAAVVVSHPHAPETALFLPMLCAASDNVIEACR